MNPVKTCSRRLFWVILIFMLLVFAGMTAAAYFGLNFMSERILTTVADADLQTPGGNEISQHIAAFYDMFHRIIIPSVGGAFLIFTLLTWFFSKRSTANVIRSMQPAGAKRKPGKKEPTEDIRKEQLRRDRRLFVHLLNVLQREGRLMDFFSEDLSLYEDAQIGAAVRSIQENCKKVVDKYLAPGAVVSENEGDQITVEKGFDPNAVRLTGNVTGEPPFTGIVRHRGWKSGKVELPILADTGSPDVIAPAEVEVG